MRIGWAICGSFCTFERAINVMRTLAISGKDITPIFSQTAYELDTRFGKAADWIRQVEAITEKPVWHTLQEVEPIGPQKLLDLLIIAPVTGNTLAKLASGITDTPVTMAAKSHLRNGRPLLLSISTNDGLSGSASNIGTLMARKNVFFVPYRQDDAVNKPASIIAEMERIPSLLSDVMDGRQPQPLLL